MNKKILIALPSAKDVETDTLKSIHRLIIPSGYEVYLETFFGYRIDQVRNLIASFAINNNFDYLFCVDSDMDLEPDTLIKLLSLSQQLWRFAHALRPQTRSPLLSQLRRLVRLHSPRHGLTISMRVLPRESGTKLSTALTW